jgi:hypothetical protein
MNYTSDSYVRNLVELLAAHVGLEGDIRIPPSTVETALRTLRPSISGSHDHTNAIKARIRQQILNHPSNTSNGSVIVSQFEKDVENLRRFNPSLPKPVLSLLKPLMFRSNTQSRQKLFQDKFRSTTNAPATPAVTAHNAFSNGPIFDDRDVGRDENPDANEDAGDEQQVNNMFWIDRSTERALLNDLVYIFQVRFVPIVSGVMHPTRGLYLIISVPCDGTGQTVKRHSCHRK